MELKSFSSSCLCEFVAVRGEQEIWKFRLHFVKKIESLMYSMLSATFHMSIILNRIELYFRKSFDRGAKRVLFHFQFFCTCIRILRGMVYR